MSFSPLSDQLSPISPDSVIVLVHLLIVVMNNDVKGVSNTGGKQLLEKRNLREEASLRQSQTKRVVDPPGL